MTREIVPAARPAVGRAGVLSFVDELGDGLPLPPFPFLVGRRGYYGDAMGAIAKNDLNVYDDALFLVEADRLTAWNANCDPGRHQAGMANLAVGRWLYRPGIHNQSKDPATHPHYRALVQAAEVVVVRDDTQDFKAGDRHAVYGECLGQGRWRGWFGINIHCGGNTVTSSLGCQTIPPAQWGDLQVHRAGEPMAEIDRALAASGHTEIPYILTSRYP